MSPPSTVFASISICPLFLRLSHWPIHFPFNTLAEEFVPLPLSIVCAAAMLAQRIKAAMTTFLMFPSFRVA
jgi:hypothetical protein